MSSKKRHPAQAQERPPCPPLPPDDVLWKSTYDFDFWPVAEACISMLSGNPAALATAVIGRRGIGYALPRGYRRWMFRLREVMLTGEMKGNIDVSEWPAGELPLAVKMKNCYVHRLSFVRWMSDKGFAIPEELHPLLEQAQPKEPEGAGAAVPPADQGSKGEQITGDILDKVNTKWRELKRAELDVLERDESIALVIQDRRVVRAPGKSPGRMTLTPAEYHLLEFYTLHRDAWHRPREGHKGEAANAPDMLKRLRRKIDPQKTWFRRNHSAPGRHVEWKFSPPAGQRFAIIKTQHPG